MAPVAVKICGITSINQARMVESAGADAIGLVLYEKSSRYVDLDLAIEIKNAQSPDIVCIALVVNAKEKFVREVISKLKPHYIQFHGDERQPFKIPRPALGVAGYKRRFWSSVSFAQIGDNCRAFGQDEIAGVLGEDVLATRPRLALQCRQQ